MGGRRSPDIPVGRRSAAPAPQTVFRAGVQGCTVDLTEARFKRAQTDGTDSRDYAATQAFARDARVDAIRHWSVRDPDHAAAFAVLNPKAFNPTRSPERQSGFLTVRAEGVVWQRDSETFEFPAQSSRT